jgi:Putative Flp pilus-assembly TadE/G-like
MAQKLRASSNSAKIMRSACQVATERWKSATIGARRLLGALPRLLRKSGLKRARGQILVLAAIAMTVLIAFVALATDVGLLWTERRHMQTATDAAAIAAAIALRNGDSITPAADNVAGLEGFTDGSDGVTVTVNNPPSSGLYAGNSDYVEVIIAQPEPTYFLRVLGYTSVNVSARAGSGSINGPACIYALDPSASGAISLTGNININASCGVIDDSASSSALSGTGNGALSATAIGVSGNYSATGNIKFVPRLTSISLPRRIRWRLWPPHRSTARRRRL